MSRKLMLARGAAYNK